MLQAVGPSFEFIRFFQIIAWILLPVFLSASLLTVFLHYRRKKRKVAVAEDAENQLILAAPEKFNHNIRDGEYVYFDHSGLIREYKTRMFYNHARYTALRNDYASLEAKYSSLAAAPAISFVKPKKHRMKKTEEPVMVMENEWPAELAAEKKELSDKLQQLSRSYQRLEEENRFLQEQINLQTAGEEEKDRIVNRWKEENKSLRDRLGEQDYLEALLEEKKSQIVFLQNQLEQRIKNQHQAEQQRVRAVAEMEQTQELQQEGSRLADALKNELLVKQEEIDKVQMLLCEKEEQLSQRQEAVGSKLDQISYLENVLRELKEQNELLNAEASDNRDIANTLQQQLSAEQGRTRQAVQKLAANKQLLRRLHQEFSACIEEEGLPAGLLPESVEM